MNTSAYLERIWYSGSLEPTLETLQNLHRAHLQTIPFETLDLHLGVPIDLELAALERKIVQNRRGGWCYELNALFATLLSKLGFDVRLKMGQPTKSDGTLAPPFAHLALEVVLEDRKYLADVGFGQSFLNSLELREGEQDGFKLERDGDFWMSSRLTREGEWKLECRLNPGEYVLEDFLEMCDFYQHSSESGFRKRSFCGLHTARGYEYVSELTHTLEGLGEKQDLALEPGEYGAVLLQSFGVSLSGAQLERLKWGWLERRANPL